MFVAFGWVKIQSSQADYERIDPGSSKVDDLDDALSAADKVLFKDLIGWLEAHDDKLFKPMKWQFTPEMNYETGILQFHASRNRRYSIVWDLIDFIRFKAKVLMALSMCMMMNTRTA